MCACLLQGKARFVSDCASYIQSCMKPATDIFISGHEMVASIVVLPLIYKGQTFGGFYGERGVCMHACLYECACVIVCAQAFAFLFDALWNLGTGNLRQQRVSPIKHSSLSPSYHITVLLTSDHPCSAIQFIRFSNNKNNLPLPRSDPGDHLQLPEHQGPAHGLRELSGAGAAPKPAAAA